MKTDFYEKNYFSKRLRNRNLDAYNNDFNFVNQCIAQGSHILDYGCGEMVLTDILASKYKVSVFDISEEITQMKKFKTYGTYATDVKYDAIILRGIIQHHPSPFELIKKLSTQLQNTGSLIFLATPNTNSLYYSLNHELPALDRANNFWIPSNIELEKYMAKVGWYKYIEQYPYLKSGYAMPIKDHLKFMLNLLGIKKFKYPFWKSMMNVCYKKN